MTGVVVLFPSPIFSSFIVQEASCELKLSRWTRTLDFTLDGPAERRDVPF